VIETRNLVAGYGKLRVIKGVSVMVESGAIVSIIGANGAGKSTLLRCIQGLTKPWSGEVIFDGEDITPLAPEKIVRRGLTLVPENKELFPNLSVHDNLVLGGYVFRNENSAAEKRRTALDQIYAFFPALQEKQKDRAATLSGGQQQMLAIGRALMTRPRALMLDEPSLGLAPMVVRQIFEVLGTLSKSGIAILLVEQNIRSALHLAQRGYVLETGTIVSSGSSKEILNDPAVMKAYLGTRRGANV
jgi:branched-chain amino acid transport system ATP-binding protein